MSLFKDKIAIVTGGASGIGRAICEQLAQRGKTVIVADINREGAEQVASGINETGGPARAAHLDVTQAEQIRTLIDETASEHARLDYIFNNAGITIGGEAQDITLEHWKRIVSVNLWGVIYGTTSAYSVMVGQGFGHIVNTASVSGLVPAPMTIPYCATKHAVVGLSTSLRAEGEALGVKVTVVCPGYVQTHIYDTTPVLNVDKAKAIDKIPVKMMDPTKAADRILRGVARNRAIIVFPLHARALWWILRLHPSILSPLFRKMLKDFRALRLDA
jgi:NAD(P)-dependent dehydrogenase (short-subunit alcohol dehydrogenase family)